MRTKKVTQRLNEIDRDLETTEKLFYASRNNKWRESINKIRYVLIVEMHKLKYSNENIDVDAIEQYHKSINQQPEEDNGFPDPGSRFKRKYDIDIAEAERYYLSGQGITYKMVASMYNTSFDYIKKLAKEGQWFDKKNATVKI